MFKQRVGRALHRPLPAQSAQHAARERRLAGAELARQRHHHAAREPAGERAARALGRGGVGEVRAERSLGIGSAPVRPVRYARAMTPATSTRQRARRRARWTSARSRAPRDVGARARLRRDRRRRTSSSARRRAPARLDRRRPPRRDGLYGAPRRAARARRPTLVPGAVRVISVRIDYWPAEARDAQAVLDAPDRAYVSRYALGRDYHKVMRAQPPARSPTAWPPRSARSATACSATARR